MSAEQERKRGRSPRRATLALLFVTVLWGWTFVWMKEAVGAAERELGARGAVAGIGLFMALRFGLASLAMPLVPAARRGWTPGAWRGGALIGALLLAGFLLQMFGLRGVSPAVSAFLTSLYVLFTALALAARTRKPPSAALGLGALLATFGAGFIGGPPQITFGLGEWLTVACAFVFALHILATDAVTQRESPMPVTLISFAVVALGAVATLAFGVTLDGGPGFEALVRLSRASDFWRPVLLSCALATVLALSLMNLYQRELDPVRAAIVYAIEPVWAAAIAIASGLERPTVWLWIGGGSLLAGNLVAELGPRLYPRVPREIVEAPPPAP
jgi:drug/metabolite transporter (DMT)-like permease